MKLYLYQPEGSSALDFSVRRVPDDEEWPFEVCNVQEGGVAFGAGLRAGDRGCGFSDYSCSGHKKARNWGDDTLLELGARVAGTLFILFVDKRVAVGPEEDTLMKKRLDFISARKSNLKRVHRLDELSKFVQKWDKRNVKTCVYDIDFTVRKVGESVFEVAGLERTSVAYRSGVRNGDVLCGFNHFDEDGRMKAHDWYDETLDDIKERQLVFVLVGKKNPLREAERS
ncbi:uncharacterized protein IUM83_05022 [Phytophthora cinnamomi]|uniref:uncharacterized protein n=1 Tax=Phytophthora cinnamomi TaxID=4785 RepID=UPI003559735B|nr:hypothetical protein IUM83_05022 [Phytophthora cinnamomi]